MPHPASEGALAHRRVLVVEDEYFIADDMVRVLQKLGADVVGPVQTAEKAMALLQDSPVDVAVLDINLRGRMVFPVADALRDRGVPFVFATGYTEAAVPPDYSDVPLWEKPFQPEELAKALPGLMRS